MQGLQRLPLRRRLWWMRRLWRWLDWHRRAVGGMRRLLCIVGPLPLVLALPDCASIRRDFIGRARERPGQFVASVTTFAAPGRSACRSGASVFQLIRRTPIVELGAQAGRGHWFVVRRQSAEISVLTR